MNVFQDYARYYDLLYRDKNYQAEAAYVHDLIQQFAPGKTMLELGCGTGGHGVHFAQLDYAWTGIDLSEHMLQLAETRFAAEQLPKPQLVCGDLCQLDLGHTFDVVVSLFHVMSYQTSNAALLAAFRAVRKHLQPGGVFVFDCWYGPGVLTDPPQVRVKRLEDAALKVLRIAEPTHDVANNRITVNYQVQVEDKASGQSHQLTESHGMRYLFEPELRALAAEAGMQPMAAYQWLTQTPPGLASWYACFVFKATEE